VIVPARPDIAKILSQVRLGACFHHRDNRQNDAALPEPDEKIRNFIHRGAFVFSAARDIGHHGTTHNGH
jgi:hypothetical protein